MRRARGFRARGHRAAAARSPDCGQDRSAPRRAKGFLPLAMPDLPTIFSPPVSRKFRRDPSGGFPARFRGAFRFEPRSHFVSDEPSEKISRMVATGCRRRKSETKRNAKKQPRRRWKVRHITPTSRPRREGPVISGQWERAARGGGEQAVGKALHSFPVFRHGFFWGPAIALWGRRTAPMFKLAGYRALRIGSATTFAPSTSLVACPDRWFFRTTLRPPLSMWTSSLFPDSLIIDPMRPFSKSYC